MDKEQDKVLSELFIRAQAADADAYRRLLQQLLPLLHGYFAKRWANAADTQDLVQETLLRLHRARHTYQSSRPFGPWFYAVAQHCLVDWARRHNKRRGLETPLSEQDEATHPAPQPEAADERLQILRQGVAELPEKQRRVVTLLKYEERSVAQAAGELKMSVSAVKITAWRAYRTLRQWLRGNA